MANTSFAHRKAISASYVHLMADLVERYGGCPKALLKKAGISSKQESGLFSFITIQQYEALLREALAVTGNPALGLYMGAQIKFSDHGTFAYSALSFPTLWDAMRVGLKFSRLANQVVDLKLEEGRSHNIIRIDTAYFYDDLYRTLIEMVMSLFCEILRFMLNEDISPIQINFNYPEPAYAEQYHKVFRPALRFECAANEVIIPKRLANKPLPMANPEVAAKFEQECDDLITKIYEPKSHAQQVYEALYLSRGGFPLLEDIAAQGNVSSRTLRRRLHEAGTSYKKILDEVRLALANRYLSTSRMSIGEIAELLGYTDQNSFSYAYKQLTGMPPTVYRKRSQESPDS